MPAARAAPRDTALATTRRCSMRMPGSTAIPTPRPIPWVKSGRTPFGLFDVHGNVYEWCWDGYDEKYYAQSPVDDPRGPAGAADRVFRGGCWGSIPQFCRSAFRFRFTPGYRSIDLGFRLARVQSGSR